MLTLQSKLDAGKLEIISAASGKLIANGILDEGHDIERALLIRYLSNHCAFNCIIKLDGDAVGKWVATYH